MNILAREGRAARAGLRDLFTLFKTVSVARSCNINLPDASSKDSNLVAILSKL